MFDGISSVSVASLDLLDSPVDFDDLAFLSLILNLQESDQALVEKMRDVREMSKLKREITDEISRLNKAIKDAEATDADDVVEVTGENGIEQPKFSSDPNMQFLEDEGFLKQTLFTKGAVDSRLSELQSQLEEMNSASEIMMIDLNRLMNKRQQAVQLTSNILQKSHQTALSLIANFK